MTWRQRVAYSLSFAAIFLAVLWGINWAFRVSAPRLGLVFPPNTGTHHYTREFDSRASINSLGFRGSPEVSERKRPGVPRIVVLGDSYTYGWGVDDQETWPYRLQSLLSHSLGRPVEVLNLGKPGSGPFQYLEIARKALPRLEPDLVIVAILQNDDLKQSARRARSRKLKKKGNGSAPDMLARLDGMFLSDIRRWKQARGDRIRIIGPEHNAGRVARLLTKASEESLRRIDPDVLTMFREGHLHPGLLTMTLKTPERLLFALRPESQEFALARAGLTHVLTELSVLAEGVGSRLLVVSVPYGAYFSEEQLRAWRAMGLEAPENLLGNRHVDDPVAEVCLDLGLSFVATQPRFFEAAAGATLYFPFDGHLSTKGHEAFAQSLEERVADVVGRL